MQWLLKSAAIPSGNIRTITLEQPYNRNCSSSDIAKDYSQQYCPLDRKIKLKMGAAASVNTSSIDLLNNDDQSHRNVSEEISPDSEDSNVAEMYMNYARKDVMHKILSNAAGREAFMRFLSVECQGKKLMSSEVIRSIISLLHH